MNRKGFTLVELLAVIAILAILVIVAMPNVLGMFNQAKINTFTTEVQRLMDVAMTTFTKDALLNSGKSVFYSSVDFDSLKTKKLDMSGNKKDYFIEMDRNGNFKRIVVADENFCYDIYTEYNGSFPVVGIEHTMSRPIVDQNNYPVLIDKTTVKSEHILESGNDSFEFRERPGTSHIIMEGCEKTPVDTFNIDGTEYKYELGMTWEDWVSSSYNTDGFVLDGDLIVKDSKSLRYNILTRIYSYYSDNVVEKADEIVMNVKYKMVDYDVDPNWVDAELKTLYLKLYEGSTPRVRFYDMMRYVKAE